MFNQNNVDITKQTYKKIFTSYAGNNSSLPGIVREMLDKFISLVPGKRVLDIGCANGRESKYLYEHSLDVTGCDITEEFMDIAKQNCPNCSFFVADMRNLDLPENSFDGL